jgi:hypothetical protein
VRQKVSQSDLAAVARMARENVSRVLHDWAGRSLVSLLAGYYRLENKAVLQLDNCHKHTEQRACRTTVPQFVIHCLDGAIGPTQPSVVAPEYQELAARRAKEKERVDNCQRQATEQKVLPRDRPQFVISCLEK